MLLAHLSQISASAPHRILSACIIMGSMHTGPSYVEEFDVLQGELATMRALLHQTMTMVMKQTSPLQRASNRAARTIPGTCQHGSRVPVPVWAS